MLLKEWQADRKNETISTKQYKVLSIKTQGVRTGRLTNNRGRSPNLP